MKNEKRGEKAKVKEIRGQDLERDFHALGRGGKAVEKTAQHKQPEASRWAKLGNRDRRHRGTPRDRARVGNFRVVRKG